MKKTFISLVMICFLFSCSKDFNESEYEVTNENNPEELKSVDFINKFIENELEKNGDVDWKNVPANILWSAAFHGEKTISVGYGKDEDIFTKNKGQKLLSTKNNILKTIQKTENSAEGKKSKSNENIVSDDTDDVLNIVHVKVTKLETIKALLKLDNVEFIEPIGYYQFEDYIQNLNSDKLAKSSSSSGCSKNADVLDANDYVQQNGYIIPWNYYHHRIPEAWSTSTGAGITVGVIDTGVSEHQYYMTPSGFKDGFSINSRYIERHGTYIPRWKKRNDGFHDKCGHGTKSASMIGAPANTSLYPVGIAYNCNLISYRATSDVVLNTGKERRAVARAINNLANNYDVKIISMALGSLMRVRVIERAIKYAHRKGKLIVAAGGTSTYITGALPIVTFPGRMNEVVGVTGRDDSGDRCIDCHTGSAIDFTAIMQFTGWRNREKTVPTLGYYTGHATRFGGSSSSTGIISGIAALIWAKKPSLTRDEVYDIMKRASQYPYNKSDKFGHGNIDVAKALTLIN